MLRALGRLLAGGGRAGSDEWGPVAPCCGRYDWPEQPVTLVDCRTGVHRVKTCPCGHQEIRFDCEDH